MENSINYVLCVYNALWNQTFLFSERYIYVVAYSKIAKYQYQKLFSFCIYILNKVIISN